MLTRLRIRAIYIGWETQVIEAIVRRIQEYGVEVRLRDGASLDEDLGRISGSTIEVVSDPVEPTIALFTMCHLFGHLVQFTDRGRYMHLLDPVSKAPPNLLDDDFWQEFYAYE